jgi:hypothetical protein
MKVKCDNCAWEGDNDSPGFIPLEECEALVERLEPGCEVPAGDCPECHAFCYLVEDGK